MGIRKNFLYYWVMVEFLLHFHWIICNEILRACCAEESFSKPRIEDKISYRIIERLRGLVTCKHSMHNSEFNSQSSIVIINKMNFFLLVSLLGEYHNVIIIRKVGWVFETSKIVGLIIYAHAISQDDQENMKKVGFLQFFILENIILMGGDNCSTKRSSSVRVSMPLYYRTHNEKCPSRNTLNSWVFECEIPMIRWWLCINTMSKRLLELSRIHEKKIKYKFHM